MRWVLAKLDRLLPPQAPMGYGERGVGANPSTG